MWVKRILYRAGLRPRPHSLFYSPSLALTYAISDAMQPLNEALTKALREAAADLHRKDNQ